MEADDAQPVRTVLLDIQGTLLSEHGNAYAGVPEALRRLRADGRALRFVTNIDSVAVSTIVTRLRDAGIHAQHAEVFTPAAAALRFLERRNGPRCYLLLTDEVAQEFSVYEGHEGRVDFVVVGDCRDEFTYQRLNEAFRHLVDGAELLALQKGRYFLSPEGPTLDTGAFVAALEYGAGRVAHVVGKPSSELLELAIDDVGCSAASAVMVGDDVASDVSAAHAAGARSVLVKTGKFSGAELELSDQQPDLLIDSVADLPDALAELGA